MSFIHLHTMQQSLIVLLEPTPTLIYWGEALENVCGSMFEKLALGVPQAGLDTLIPLSLIPQMGRACFEISGLEGHRQGQEWASVFTTTSWKKQSNQAEITCKNHKGDLSLVFALSLSDSNVFSLQVTLHNTGNTPYALGRLAPTVPLPMQVHEYMNLCGDWAREFQIERCLLGRTFAVQENRTGRTSHHAPPFLLTGSQGFDETQGDVFAFHLAWSGNHGFQAGICANGQPFVQAYELLMPGEIALETGQSYTTPWLYGTYSHKGLSQIRQQFHGFVRQQFLSETTALKPRPVHVNTWEAVYFDHDLSQLMQLAQAAADIGVERFVLDDGWFKGRHDETSSLGNWTPDPKKYPDGLMPLIHKVHDLGLEFGLWVEPEMVNPDSDLYRAHPEWILQIPNQPPHLARGQLVLDLQNPHVFDSVFNALKKILDAYPIDYLKWDMNRPLTQAGHKGYPAMHGHVQQVYRLLDAIRSRYPQIEIESCASGGGRMDYAVLNYCQRFWVSDNNDPVERQKMYPVVSCFFPPEVLGAHIGPKVNPVTGRRISLSFSVLTTLFYHMGFECDVSTLSQGDKVAARAYTDLYKRLRSYFHTGDLHFPPVPDPSVSVCALHAQGELFVLITQLHMARFGSGFSLKLPYLQDNLTYQVSCLDAVYSSEHPSMKTFPDYLDKEQTWVGQWLQRIGLPIPALPVHSGLLLHFVPLQQKSEVV